MKSEYRQSLSLLEKCDFVRWNEDLWDNGCHVWLPRGAKLKRLFYRQYTDTLQEYGFREMQLPRLVPEDVLDRVADAFMDFRESVYWMSTREDDEYEHAPYYLNSTSDPVLNYVLADEVDSRSDLPYRVYLREQLFRPHGSTSTRPFIDSDENVDVIECYSVRSTRQASLKDFSLAFSLLEAFMSDICLAWYRVERPEWGNKPVADRVHSLQTLLPDFECSTRVGTVYHHDQTFSRIFDVTYPDGDGAEYVHQTAFGFGERTLFTMLNQHADRHGLRLPPVVAPTQVALIPFTSDERDRARRLASKLDVRTDVDEQFNQSYQKRLGRYLESGVPLRVGIKTGDRQVEVSRRDTLERFTVAPERLVVDVDEYLADVTAGLRSDADSLLTEATTRATGSREFDDALADDQLIQLPWCGDAACGKRLEADHPGEFLGECIEETPREEECLVCGETATAVGFYGRRSPSP